MTTPGSTAGHDVLRVLTVCLGNICRSPAAAAAIRRQSDLEGLAVEVDSAGTGTWHIGDPPHELSRRAGREAGLDVGGTARQVSVADFDEFDVIVAMDRSNLASLLELAPTEDKAKKVRLLREDGGNVPDPYGGPYSGYQEMMEIIVAETAKLVSQLVEESAEEGPK